MRKTSFFALPVLGLLLVGIYACDSSNPVAPGGTVLTITATPTLIGITGSSSVIRVTGFRPDGNPLNPGTQITFSTTLGTLTQGLVEVDSQGVAETRLVSTGQSGAAMITASPAASDVMAQIMVTIGDDDTSRPQLTVTVTPAELDINEDADVVVDIRNADGSPFAGSGQVTLTTTLGCFGGGNANCPTQITRSISGQSRIVAPFNSLDEAGTATIRALLGSAEAEAMVAIDVERPQLLMTVNPSIIPVGGSSEVQILARDVNGTPLGSSQRIRIVGDLGVIQPENGGGEVDAVFTDSNGEARARYVAGDRAGTGTVTATLGTSDAVMVSITIRDAVGSLNLNPSVSSINRVPEGVDIGLSATVLNAQGDSIGGVLVSFSAEVGSLSTPSGSATTNPQGIATETLTVTEENVMNIPENGTFTITAQATSEGATVSETVTITVTGAP